MRKNPEVVKDSGNKCFGVWNLLTKLLVCIAPLKTRLQVLAQ